MATRIREEDIIKKVQDLCLELKFQTTLDKHNKQIIIKDGSITLKKVSLNPTKDTELALILYSIREQKNKRM